MVPRAVRIKVSASIDGWIREAYFAHQVCRRHPGDRSKLRASETEGQPVHVQGPPAHPDRLGASVLDVCPGGRRKTPASRWQRLQTSGEASPS
jgi:hypothetical protein